MGAVNSNYSPASDKSLGQNGVNEDRGQSIENDREFKAHIYQQLVDLQPFLSADSQVAVLVQHEQDEESLEDGAEKEYALTLVATLGDYRLEAEGRDSDVYEAFSIAKQGMLEQLEEYYSMAVDTTERDAEIQTLLEGGHTIH